MKGVGLTPAQCRMARAALNWSADRLARAAGTSVKSVFRFELGQVPGPIIAARFRSAFIAQGIHFGTARAGWSVSLRPQLVSGPSSKGSGP